MSFPAPNLCGGRKVKASRWEGLLGGPPNEATGA